MQDAKCKICRRLGEKLFLKGEKCLSAKCLMVKRPYAPGQKGKRRRRRRGLSDYGKELAEKQKLKNWYNLKESQFRKYVKEVLRKRGRLARGATRNIAAGAQDTTLLLIQKLESRLDNVVFRLGFATSRAQARQMVSHGHFSVNKKMVNIPSYSVKKGDVIQLLSKGLCGAPPKKHEPPKWLKLDVKNLQGEVVALPTLEEAAPPVEISAIFEYYSR